MPASVDSVQDEVVASVPEAPACRLYVILAREAATAVVFRRGPSKWVQVIHWDTATDTFTHGQWFHGRIYEKRCDLSPDGTLLIYFAQKMQKGGFDPTYSYAWTAISRLPYLTALALWPNGCCWGGGGLFLSDKEVWLNQREDATVPHPDHRPQGLTISHDGGGGGEDDPIHALRLDRDGWRHTQKWRGGLRGQGYVTDAPDIRRKQNPHGWQKLTRTTTVSGFESRDGYSVRYAEGNDQRLEGATWADWDQRGRLVYVREGRLFGLVITADGLGGEQELADFNGNRPEPVAAPVWAREW